MRGQGSLEYLLTVGGVLIAAVLIGSFLINAASKIYNSVTGVSGATLEVSPNPGKVAYWESTEKLGAASFLTVGSNMLTVSGRLVANEICLAGSCINSWPSGGGSTGAFWKPFRDGIYYDGGVVEINGHPVSRLRVTSPGGSATLAVVSPNFMSSAIIRGASAILQIHATQGNSALAVSNDAGNSVNIQPGKVSINNTVELNSSGLYSCPHIDVNSVDANYLCLNGKCIGSWDEVNQTTSVSTEIPITYSWSVAPYDKIGTGICTVYNGTMYCELKASLCMGLCGESGLTSNCIDATDGTGAKYSCDHVLWPVTVEDISEVPVSDSDGDSIGEIQSSGTITFDFQGATTSKGWSYRNILIDCESGSTRSGYSTIGPYGIEFKTGAWPYYCLEGTAEYNIWIGRTINATICAIHGYSSGVDSCAFRMYIDGTRIGSYSSVWCRSTETTCGTVTLTPGYHQIKIIIRVDDSRIYENTAAYLSKVTISGLSGEIIYSKTYNEMYEIK